jgi:amino acid adenylation domain-containing protein
VSGTPFLALAPPRTRTLHGEPLEETVALRYELEGDVDPERLRAALHDLLIERTGLCRDLVANGQAVLALEVVDLSRATEAVRTTVGRSREVQLRERVARVVEPGVPPLLSATLVLEDDDPATLLLVGHRRILDETSAGQFPELLSAACERSGAAGAEAHGAEYWTYADHLFSEALPENGARRHAALARWSEALEGAPPPLDLPTDHPRPALRQALAESVDARLAPAELAALREAASRVGVSLHALLLACWALVLRRWSGQHELTVGTQLDLRPDPRLRDAIGAFGSALPIRLELDDRLTLEELLRQSAAQLSAAVARGPVDPDALVERLDAARDASMTPLFQTLLIHEESPEPAPRGGLALRRVLQPPAAVPTDLVLHSCASGRGLALQLSCDLGLFTTASARSLIRQLAALLRQLPARMDAELPSLELRDTEERAWQRLQNRTTQPLPAAATVLDFLEEELRSAPATPAVSDVEGELSRGELEELVLRQVRSLVAAGVGPGTLVGICLQRSRWMIVSTLAILRAGAAFVPLDPAFPRHRLAYMVEHSRIEHVVAEPATRDRLPAGPRVHDARALAAGTGDAADETPARSVRREDLAYVIYTSGSTGRPKGVSVPHGALLNFLLAMRRVPGLGAGDVLVAVTTLSFDISVLELFLPLLVGARCVIATEEDTRDPRRLSSLLRSSGATALQATPSRWRLLLEAEHAFEPGFLGLCGGEPLPKDLARKLLAQGVRLWNLYGPTETTIWSSVDRVTDPGHITIGRPIANTAFYVVDEHGGRCPVGVPGELCIGGRGVAAGYLHAEALTGERFVPDPFGEGEHPAPAGGRMYRTGDRVRMLPDGRYEHLGRLDDQVKLRGHRIELGEIEATILAEGLAAECAALVAGRAPDGERLVVCLVDGRLDSTVELRQRLAERLPAYMVPQAFVPVPALPRTPNGKLDRRRLPELLTGAPESSVTPLPRRTRAMEIRVAHAFASALELREVSLDDDFFELGGHSLLALKVADDLENQTGLPVPVGLLFEHPTARGLASQLEADASTGTRPILLSGDEGKPPLFLIAGIHIYRPLARRLGDAWTVYGTYVDVELPFSRAEHPTARIPELVEAYLAVIRSTQPEGPYRLAGFSFGGVLAYEIAAALRATGAAVEFVGLIDAYLPSRRRSLGTALRGWTKLGPATLARLALAKFRNGSGRALTAAPLRSRPTEGLAQELEVLDALRLSRFNEAVAAHADQLRTLDAPVTLVLATRRLAEAAGQDPLGGWGALAPRLEVRSLDGHHRDLVDEPLAAELAALLRRAMTRSGAAAQPPGTAGAS